MANLLEVKDLVTQFHTESGLVRAVNGVSYHIEEQRPAAVKYQGCILSC